MKSLIILKGLVKSEKKKWVSEQGLDTFFLDYEYHQTLYSTPEIIKSSTGRWDYLGRIKTKPAHDSFLRALNSRMENGCLVIVDLGMEKASICEAMAKIYGYSVFYKVFPVPQDYLGNPRKYSNPMYRVKKREELEDELKRFMNFQTTGKHLIETYKDVEDYWNPSYLEIPNNEDVYVFSDIHGNYDLLKGVYDSLPVDSYKIFLGDYIDGETIPGGSKDMIDFVCSEVSYNVRFIEGNHERRLRKYLYTLMKKDDTLSDILLKSLPEDWLNTVAVEFSMLSSKEARQLLDAMNRILRQFILVKYNERQYIITHGGLKCLEQISPKYIGNITYGNRDIDEQDKAFSRDIWKKSGTWSVHGHCKYPDPNPEILKYEGVINLDPRIERGIDNPEILYINLKDNKLCIVQ